jgi:uncharacterized Zn-finger protein
MNEDLNPLTNRKFVINLVKSKDNKLSFVRQKGKSEVWNTFERIYYDNNETLYVKCKYCDDIQKNTTNGGTGGLLRHISACLKKINCFESEKIVETRDKSLNTIEENTNQFIDSSDESMTNEMVKNFLINDRSYFINLVKSGDKKLSFVAHKGKSDVWNHFERIFYDNCETLFVKCKYCDDIQKNIANYGTGGLLRHISICLKKINFDSRKAIEMKEKFLSDSNESNLEFNNTSNKTMSSENNKTFLINDRNYFLNLVKSRDQKLSFVPQKGKSEVWNHFERIYYDNCETLYVKCKYCDDIQKNTTGGGTGGLLRHKCKLSDDNYESNDEKKSVLKSNLRKKLIDEKSLIKKLSQENKTLKVIVEKCLKSIDKCLCINKYNSKEREDINDLIDDYNKWLNDFKDYDIFEENYIKLNEDSDNGKNRSYDENCIFEGQEMDSNSDNDSDYNPYKEKKQLKLNSKRNVNNLKLKRNNFNQKVTNSIKNKYKKKVKKLFNNPNEKYVCEWPGCEKKFYWSQHLKEHKDVIHLNIKNYRCDWPGCDEAFLKSNQLRIHVIKDHTNDKPFKCDQCSYTTLYKGLD